MKERQIKWGVFKNDILLEEFDTEEEAENFYRVYFFCNQGEYELRIGPVEDD